MIRCAESITTKVRKEPGAMTRGALRAWVGADRRDVFGEAFDQALGAGWIEERTEPGQGDERARLFAGQSKP